uniref:phage holin family protein n=1 Tax=Castellaniella defragrans TaxID=75697 RepID=UPI00333F612E
MSAAAIVLLIANLISIALLMGYRPRGSKHKPAVSWCAFAILCALISQAVDVGLDHGRVSWSDAFVSVILAVLVIRARGNVASLTRCKS